MDFAGILATLSIAAPLLLGHVVGVSVAPLVVVNGNCGLFAICVFWTSEVAPGTPVIQLIVRAC
jgi:hypothetical protein